MKIAVYAIALNEEQHVQRWLAAAADADCLVVADTGSTDKTGKYLQQHYADSVAFEAQPNRMREILVHDISIKPFRFDTARNAALALVPADVDVCIALDLDEELQPGWRAALETAWEKGEHTRARYTFILERDTAGNVTKQMHGHRIHARHGYDWKYPCHEALIGKRGVAEGVVYIDGLVIEHKPDKDKSRGNYVRMLAAAQHEYPDDPRMLFYYGRELMYAGGWAEGAKVLRRYLEVQQGWPEQRAEAMRYLAKCLSHGDEPDTASPWLLRACLEAPHERVNWIEFAEVRRQHGDWIGGLYGANNALACAERPADGYFEPRLLSVAPFDIGAICAYELGLKDIAALWFKEAYDRDPTDERLKANLGWAKKKKKKAA